MVKKTQTKNNKTCRGKLIVAVKFGAKDRPDVLVAYANSFSYGVSWGEC